MADNKLQGPQIQSRSIDVYGITGEFVVAPGSIKNRVVVKYFQTVASNRTDEKSGNAAALLDELRPMRDRVKCSDLPDLRSLLQRDLSDQRIATELVPYLQGKRSPVGFFPSILVSLMPKGFLTNSSVVYPTPEPIDLTVKYSNFWSVENYKFGDQVVSLARLSVNPEQTDLVVLDGQHRANAFRYLADVFDDAKNPQSIYSVFYQNCDKPAGKDFNAELPVTIVWFECPTGVEANLISRKLFVDVNTNAKQVSDSRNILLDDRDIASVCVTDFYGILAERTYKTDCLSLLHGGFDCDGTFPKDFPATALFSPQNVHYMLCYFLLANTQRVEMGTKITRDLYPKVGKYTGRLLEYCDVTDDLLVRVGGGDSDALDLFVNETRKSLTPKLVKVIEGFKFLAPHFDACSSEALRIARAGVIEESSAWEKVFTGGEGLYNAFVEAREANEADDQTRIMTYVEAIDTINNNVRNSRKSKIENYSLAFETFTSKAGFTGFFMALERCFENDGWSDQLVDDFLVAVNNLSPDVWVTVLTDYKRRIVPENSPRLWPLMREIFLRFIEPSSNGWTFFSTDSLDDYHPDFIFCKNHLLDNINSDYRENMSDAPESTVTDLWIDDSIKTLNDLLGKINIAPVNGGRLKTKLVDFLTIQIEKKYGQDEDGE